MSSPLSRTISKVLKRKVVTQHQGGVSKRLKHVSIVPIIDTTWVSASRLRNFSMADTLIDWMDMWGHKAGFKCDPPSKYNFKNYIMQRGVDFETWVMQRLSTIFCKNMITTIETTEYLHDITRYPQQMKSTLEAMQQGVPCIYQGIVWNTNNSTYGHPDILVRSDYLHKFIELHNQYNTKIDVDTKPHGCKWSTTWHYVVVDIKFSGLDTLPTQASRLSNSGSNRAYKYQISVYNQAISQIQGYQPITGYLLGRNFKFVAVDFDVDDRLSGDVASAVAWINDVRQNGESWKVLPKPSVAELYPNMSCANITDWNQAKSKIAHELHEVTLLWQCGVKNREYARENHNITKYDDVEVSASTLGVNGRVYPDMLNNIIKVNKNPEWNYIIGNYEKCKIPWTKSTPNNFYVDFETVNGVYEFDSRNIQITMIGCTSSCGNNFLPLLVDNFNLSNEKRIVNDFIAHLYLNSVEIDKQRSVRCFHYSHPEPTYFREACKTHNIVLPHDLTIEWIDLLAVLKHHKIAVKSAFNYSLKSIVNSLSIHGEITINYDECDIIGGLDAMVAMIHANERVKSAEITKLSEDKCCAQLVKYNRVDCDSLFQLRNWLKKILSF